MASFNRSLSALLVSAAGLSACTGFVAGAGAAPVEVYEATIPELQRAMEAGRVTSAELVDAYLARIEAFDRRGPEISAVLTINPHARAEADRLDRERAERGPRGPLHGIPVLMKDNYDTFDMPTSAGSVALAQHQPRSDAYQVRRLREAGAVILGKTNLHELAYGITTISSAGGQTRNPYVLARNPGGSSGGTGAAVAASFAAIGWGSDTCGSIRIPATHNSLVGLRPTKGLSSIGGIIPLAATQDVGGPLARTVTDLAIGLDATIGPDPADPATAVLAGRPLPRFVDALTGATLRGSRVGLFLPLLGTAPEDEQVAAIVRRAVEEMGAAGAEVVEIDVPDFTDLIGGTSLIDAEFKWNLIDYLARTPDAPVGSLTEILERGLFHPEVESRLRNSDRHASREPEGYRDALAKREVVRERMIRLFEENRLDALAYPTIRRIAAVIGEPAPGSNCQLSATTGMPALTVQAGFSEEGVPVGIELLGLPFRDAELVALGYAYEQATRHRRPPASTPPLAR
ncbi:MAG TPA: amidase family protein [Longimicrobiaceae bacterium]|nr:amidase family protein [Longimicrobiaceae bacterium]